jgi:hypothetical protein
MCTRLQKGSTNPSLIMLVFLCINFFWQIILSSPPMMQEGSQLCHYYKFKNQYYWFFKVWGSQLFHYIKNIYQYCWFFKSIGLGISTFSLYIYIYCWFFKSIGLICQIFWNKIRQTLPKIKIMQLQSFDLLIDLRLHANKLEYIEFLIFPKCISMKHSLGY